MQIPGLGTYYWLQKSANPRARQEGNQFFVEYGSLCRRIVGIAWLTTIAAIVAAVSTPNTPGNELSGKLLLIGVISMFAMWAHSSMILKRIVYDERDIRVRNWYGSTLTIPWDRVHGITGSNVIDGYTLRIRGERDIQLSSLMSGIQSLIDEVEKHHG